MTISDYKIATKVPPRKVLSMERNDFPLTVQYGDTTYVLVATKGNKLLLQKPLI
ncbi:MAG: hypothetical protein PHI31_03430 [Desulfuromonadaceae bacterium]|nr:hypothetical protein [Desulfuromonadaceae bacterium]